MYSYLYEVNLQLIPVGNLLKLSTNWYFVCYDIVLSPKKKLVYFRWQLCFLHPFPVRRNARGDLSVPNKADGGILPEGSEQRRGKLNKRKEFRVGETTWLRRQICPKSENRSSSFRMSSQIFKI